MTRFSRLRRSAGLLILTAGFGLTASPVRSETGSQESSRPGIATACRAVAVDAYVSSFKTMIHEAATKQFNSFPIMTKATTLAQVILKENAIQKKNILLETAPPTASMNIQLPKFAFTMVFDGPPEVFSSWCAEAAGMQSARQLLKHASPTPFVQHHIGADGLERIGIDFDITPRIIIEEKEELLLGVETEILETEALEIDVQPLMEPGLLALNDAAPGENPSEETNLADYVPQLPAGDDAPTENPILETSVARIVSPTMSPDQYLAAFQDRILSQQEPRGQVIRVAHAEPVPTAEPAEALAFDGPAQITLQDGPGKTASGFAWPAQPAAPEESLDDLAQRLEREFLQRAVSGQIKIEDDCPGVGTAVSSGARTTKDMPAIFPSDPGLCGNIVLDSECKSTKPAACGIGQATCQASAAASCSCVGCPKACGAECCCTKNDRPLPIPAVTINPYCQGPGAGTVLPSDFDFWCRSPVEVPTGSPCGVSAGDCPGVCAAPPTSCTPQPTAYPPQAVSPYGTAPRYPLHVPQFAAVPSPHQGPATFVPCAPQMTAPQMALIPQPQRGEWMAPVAASWIATCAAPATMPGRSELNPEALETHREISRLLDKMADRCESQGLYQQADGLRNQAHEFRMSARAIQGQLSAVAYPLAPIPGTNPVAWFPTPPMYVPEPAPALPPTMQPSMPSPVAPATYPEPLPIAQPGIATPRF